MKFKLEVSKILTVNCRPEELPYVIEALEKHTDMDIGVSGGGLKVPKKSIVKILDGD